MKTEAKAVLPTEALRTEPRPKQAADLNFWRQMDVFNPAKFKKEVCVVGCGAIGSHLVETLIRSGIGNIVVYDHDTVEDHNIPNQAFRNRQIGMKKVEAMQELARELGAEIEIHDEKLFAYTPSGYSYLFLAVDSMDARMKLMESVYLNPFVRVIEVRMAAEYGLIFTVNPLKTKHMDAWKKEWVSDTDAKESVCTNRAVATTAKTLSSMMVHYLIAWEAEEPVPFSTFYSMRPPMITTKFLKED